MGVNILLKKLSTMKPYLKWAGGKRQLIPELKDHIPKKFETYYEPFVGAGALFFYLQPQNAVINDYNEQLICTYRVIRDNPEELINLLKIHKLQNSKEYFEEIRALDKGIEFFKSQTDVQKAARLIFLNKTCYNGLYRVNSQGLFNVPYGRYNSPNICEDNLIRTISRYLKTNNIKILQGDYSQAILDVDKNSFVYFDPPYHSPNNTNFTGYQAGGFNEQEQIRLKQTFDELTKKGVPCLVSNSNTEFIRDLYKDYSIKIVIANRSINSNAYKRGKITEVIVKNY